MSEQPFPSAEDAERALLGGLILEGHLVDDMASRLSPADFYRPDHGKLFGLLVEMSSRDVAVDMVTVSDRVARMGKEADLFGGVGYVLEMPERCVSTANIGHYADIISETAQHRRIIEFADKLRKRAYDREEMDTLIGDMVGDAMELSAKSARKGWTTPRDICDRMQVALENRFKRKAADGYTTGLLGLDDMLGAIGPEQLFILAARPAMGKTAMALQIAGHNLDAGHHVGFFSLEMSTDSLVERMIVQRTKVSAQRLKRGTSTGEEQDEIYNELFNIADDHNLHVYDEAGLTIEDIISKARQLKRTVDRQGGKLSMLVIDYLQRIAPSNKGDEEYKTVGVASMLLKDFAKTFGVPVIALAQLNRDCEKRKDKRPIMADLRASGQVEQDADTIMFLYRHEVYEPGAKHKGLAEALVRKQRNGKTGSVPLTFEGDHMLFGDSEEPYETDLAGLR